MADRDTRKVRPQPSRLLHKLRVGTPVETRRGPGTVVDILLAVENWEGNTTRLAVPRVVIELDEPWDGETRVTMALPHIRVKNDPVFKDPCRELWPDQVPTKPATNLRPTQEPLVGLSRLVAITRRHQ